jgi:hypothetical protein
MIKFLTASISAKIVAASLLSSFIAGAVCALTEPVVAKNAAVIATSVDRSNKGDRLRIVRRPQQNSSSANKAISSKHSLPGCEPAFSPFDGLGGEIRDQRDLFIGERSNFPAIDVHGANNCTFLQHWHGDQ